MLERRFNESIVIVIDGEIVAKITVCEARKSGRTALGVEAPRHVQVDREEVYEAKKVGAK